MEFNLTATEGRLIVKSLPKSDVTSGGLILSKPENMDIHEGIVVSVGEKLKDVNQDFELDQVVLWTNHYGVTYEFEGDEYIILNQKDIIAIKK